MYQLWMSRPGPKSEGMDENRVEYRYPVHFQQQHSVQTTSTYVLKYRVMYTVQIHTFILRTFAIICICNCTYKYLMQGSQDPNWNKRHQYRGRLIPLSSVLDPWLHADFRPVRQGSGVALAQMLLREWHQRRYRCEEGKERLLFSPASSLYLSSLPDAVSRNLQANDNLISKARCGQGVHTYARSSVALRPSSPIERV